MKRILITGALGQIGTELTMKLRDIYGSDCVIASDIRKMDSEAERSGPFEILDVTEIRPMVEVAKKYSIDTVIHLAALLSASAEARPIEAWHLNMGGLLNALETAREVKAQFFTPSSIGAFGPSTPKNLTPQETIMRPITMYGINKVAGELLCDYYFKKYHVDTRGLRLPGLISYVAPPGGGTTDYAVEIFYQAIKNGKYTCYIAQGTYMDMMYMPDALNAIADLMEANSSRLINRNSFNVTAMSFAPEELADEIKKHIPSFELNYQVDPIRQKIADSWPNLIDASAAKEEWDFHAEYDITTMTKDMIKKLGRKLKIKGSDRPSNG